LKKILDAVVHCVRPICLAQLVHQTAVPNRVKRFREIECEDPDIIVTGQVVELQWT